MKLLFLSLFLVNLAHADWAMNDISILFPLPQTLGSSKLLKLQPSLLPDEFYGVIPELDPRGSSNEELYKDMVVVAVRMDQELKEVRLVFQALTVSPFEPQAGTKAQDLGIHLTYKLGAEFSPFMEAYDRLKKKHRVQLPVQEIGVHPVLLREQMAGPFSQDLKALLLKSVGLRSLARITFMRLMSNGGVWQFAGIDVVNQQLKPLMIPRILVFDQEFTNVGSARYLSTHVTPAPRGKDTFSDILEGKLTGLKPLIQSTLNVENPALHTTETVDCLSCHTSQAAREFAYRTLGMPQAAQKYPLTNNLRMFGYFNDEPVVAQRTINETLRDLRILATSAAHHPQHE